MIAMSLKKYPYFASHFLTSARVSAKLRDGMNRGARRVRSGAIGALSVTLAVAGLSACGGGGDAPAVGSERGHCYANGSCNAGLSCLSTFCVHFESDGGADSTVSDGASTEASGAAGAGGGAAGGGGAGGSSGAAGADGGTDAASAFVPAVHAALPQVLSLGGPVLATPKVRPIFYADDPRSADISAFLAELARTGYWRTVTGEYGVGALTILPAIHVATPAPKVRTDNDLRDELATNTSGTTPTWGAADPNTIYLYVLPEGATVQIDQAACCTDFGGYHSDTTSGTKTIPYAVGCACPGFFGSAVGPLDERTVALSHELVEAVTDPFPASNPDFEITDRANLVWTAVTGGEVADMCALNDDLAVVEQGSTYAVQRSWSNAAAKASMNPCVPAGTTAPYFNSYPALDTVNWDLVGAVTRGVSVPIGSSKTIEVRLSSSGPTKAPWNVAAVDYDAFMLGTTPKLKLALDKTQGRNGDLLHLTITPRAPNPTLMGEAFIIVSALGAATDPDYQMNITMGLVTN
jgi:hypothetical protein